ncbi:HesA/MoeB/ThiF family protein [Thermoplasma sp.]|uniref:HesA/MoeB/ThiF family protein n=1 Tax=Thermoplasma sp. TaxID=1973142 RepID=UPI0012723F45|nr:HesA/MoeB/ThiF family protein [Thermoplasma sp.]KAA8923096.1 MAG: HesA/MoeB/ThiF family protein [Thermoplasma sp.]
MMPEDYKYARQMVLRQFDRDDISRIRNARVMIVGLGGVGSLIADLFVRSGVKKIVIVDRDYVASSNLYRQTLYSEDDIGDSKAEAARRRLQKINSEVEIQAINETFDASNAEDLVSSVDLVMDGTDNLTSRLIINDACVKVGRPWVMASAIETYGQVKAIIPEKTSCYRCYFTNEPFPQPTCAEVGVLSSLVTAISSIAFTIGMKILTGKEIDGSIYNLDIWNMDLDRILVDRRKDCPACGLHNYEYLTDRYKNIGLEFMP